MSFTFGEIKQYLARDMKLSIKMLKGGYTDYFMVSDIPDGKYDDMIIYSLAGIKYVEFPELGEYVSPTSAELSWMDHKLDFGYEITLCDQIPEYDDRDHTRTNTDHIILKDLRSVLPLFGHCSVNCIGEGKEAFRSPKDIPDTFDNKYLFGLGMEPDKTDITAGVYEKRFVIVLANRPKS